MAALGVPPLAWASGTPLAAAVSGGGHRPRLRQQPPPLLPVPAVATPPLASAARSGSGGGGGSGGGSGGGGRPAPPPLQRAAAAAAAAATAVSLALFVPPPLPQRRWLRSPPPLYATSFIASRSPQALSPRWDVRSTSSAEATLLLITNDTPSTVVGLWWVGYDGKEVAYASLAPGSTHIQPTFASHVWVVRAHDTSAVMGMVVGGADPLALVVAEPPSGTGSRGVGAVEERSINGRSAAVTPEYIRLFAQGARDMQGAHRAGEGGEEGGFGPSRSASAKRLDALRLALAVVPREGGGSL
ncbi:hypothetical protein MMPV_002416 [Pyropia vietnamensis]